MYMYTYIYTYVYTIINTWQTRDTLKVLGNHIEAFTDSQGVACASLPAGLYKLTGSHKFFETVSMSYELGAPDDVRFMTVCVYM